MKKIIFLLAVLVSVFSGNSFAQQTRCATDAWMQLHSDEAAMMRATMQPLFQQAANTTGRQRSVIYIPVVTHVVYNNSAQNISDEQVRSQIDALNEDFRRMNTDTFRTQDVFKSIAADAQIEFKLAVQDPNGNATTGITRTATNVTSFSIANDDVKFDSLGGKSAWDTDKYLNIWVCNFNAGGTFGYATMPGGNSVYDGVVIKYTAFGTTGGVQHPFNLGRTASHEVGHWLGLFHPFLGGCSGMSGSNCISEGDHVCDTPPVASANYTCDPGSNSCAETPTDMPDQIENYMDYTYDRCMNMFTQGQAAVMQATLNTLRSGILSSPGLQPVDSVNAGIDGARYPASGTCANSITPKIKLTNYGLQTLTSAEIHYAIDNATPVALQWTGSLASFESEIVELDETTIIDGSHSLAIYLSSANNTVDAFAGNDTVQKPFLVAPVTPVTIPFMEDFSSNYFPPVSWDSENPDVSVGWSLQSSITGSDGQTTKAALVNYHVYDVMGEQDAIITPVIDLTGASLPELTFDFAFAKKPDASSLEYGNLEVLIANDCETFTQVAGISGDDLLTLSTQQSANWKPNSAGDWQKRNVNLSAFAGQQIKIMFRAQNGLGNNLYIDNVTVAEKNSVGIEQLISKNEITVYPNPSEGGIFYLSAKQQGEAKVEVYNSLGEMMFQNNSDLNQPLLIDLRNRTSGFYLVRTTTSNWSKSVSVVVQ